MANKQSKNDKSWEKLFDKHKILESVETYGYHEITADDIREFREPRLMTKFDHTDNLPSLFRKNDLAILPNTRGKYTIGNFDVYNPLNYDEKIEPIKVKFPNYIDSIDPKNIFSESLALNVAHLSGMISYLADDEETYLTVTGRMSSKSFNYDIYNKVNKNYHNITVENSQIEIDGSYESLNNFLIIESKLHSANDFLARQLYYPYRLLSTRTDKVIQPIFFTLSNDIYSFFVYRVNNINNYNSFELVKQVDFIFDHEDISIQDIQDTLSKTKIVDEPTVPFPQADSFERVVDMLSLLMKNDLTKDEITRNYAFDKRQTDYYTNSVLYLGLADKFKNENREIVFTINKKGISIMTKNTKDKYLSLAEEILKHEVFNIIFKRHLLTGEMPNNNEIINTMKNSNLYKIDKESTYFRRSSTIRAWVKWILKLPNQY